MPTSYLRSLTSPQRSERANRHLARYLSFLAGAANAGGFLIVHQYTSHMTGIISSMADNVVAGRLATVLTGLLAVAWFVAGSLVTTLLIRWGRSRRLRSQYVLPLLLEALLFTSVCFTGRLLDQSSIRFLISMMCFGMGLQNAMITKLSGSTIRTTHVTGIVTDIGITCGRLLYACAGDEEIDAVGERRVLKLLSSLVLLFFAGGAVGAFGFDRVGLYFMLPIAGALLMLSVIPVTDDLRQQTEEWQ